MKKNSEAQNLLAQLQESIAALKDTVVSASDVAAAQERERARINKIGKPSFRDTAAVEELAKARIRLDTCEETAAALEPELEVRLESAREFLSACAAYCADMLGGALTQRYEEIAADLAAHYRERARALQVARETDSARRAFGFVSNLRVTGVNLAGCSEFERFEAQARTIAEVLSEAAKPNPDFIRFLRPASPVADKTARAATGA